MSAHEDAARAEKIAKMLCALLAEEIPAAMVPAFPESGWEVLADHAGVRPPSETTTTLMKAWLSEAVQRRADRNRATATATQRVKNGREEEG